MRVREKEKEREKEREGEREERRYTHVSMMRSIMDRYQIISRFPTDSNSQVW